MAKPRLSRSAWLLGALILSLSPVSIASSARAETVKTEVKPGREKTFRLDKVHTALAYRNTQAFIGYERVGRDRRPDRLEDRSGKKYLAKYRKAQARIIARSNPRTGELKVRFLNRGRRAKDFRFTYIRSRPADPDG